MGTGSDWLQLSLRSHRAGGVHGPYTLRNIHQMAKVLVDFWRSDAVGTNARPRCRLSQLLSHPKALRL